MKERKANVRTTFRGEKPAAPQSVNTTFITITITHLWKEREREEKCVSQPPFTNHRDSAGYKGTTEVDQHFCFLSFITV